MDGFDVDTSFEAKMTSPKERFATAFEQAAERFERAEAATIKLETAKTAQDIKRSWSDFLIAANGIYAKLEQGAKNHPKAMPWFGRKKYDRKHDLLLAYLNQARNADEHGLSFVTEEAESVNVTFQMGPMPWQTLTIGGDIADHANPPRNFRMTNLSTGQQFPIVKERRRKYLRAVDITNFDKTYLVPNHHDGEDIDVNEPAGLARLGLEYIRKIMGEAASLRDMQ